MKSLNKLFLSAVVVASTFVANADVLYWQLSNNDNNDQYAALAVFEGDTKITYAGIINEEDGTLISYTTSTADAMSNRQTADISGYTGAQYSFAIETLSLVDGQWKEGWITNDRLSYTDAVTAGYISNPIDAGSVNTWTASVQVPEPTSGLLLLVGGSLLALRRRRRA